MEILEYILIILAVFVSGSGYAFFIKLDKTDRHTLLQSAVVFTFSSAVWLTVGKLFVDSVEFYVAVTLLVVFIFTIFFGEKQ